MKYIAINLYQEITEDSFSEGEVRIAHTDLLPDSDMNDSVEKLIDELCRKYEYDRNSLIVLDWYEIPKTCLIAYRNEKHKKATEDELESWRKGEINLYRDELSFEILRGERLKASELYLELQHK